MRDTIPMATATLIPVSDYLSRAYEPDCDYIEGHLEERNPGESSHATLTFVLAKILDANRRTWNIRVIPEVRVQVAPDRYRVPDVTVLRRSDPADPIVRTAPLICLEVLSPEDRIDRLQQRFDDYFRMGVEHVWFLDPISRHAWIATPDGSHITVPEAFTISGTPIRLVLAEIFAELDDMQTPA